MSTIIEDILLNRPRKNLINTKNNSRFYLEIDPFSNASNIEDFTDEKRIIKNEFTFRLETTLFKNRTHNKSLSTKLISAMGVTFTEKTY